MLQTANITEVTWHSYYHHSDELQKKKENEVNRESQFYHFQGVSNLNSDVSCL